MLRDTQFTKTEEFSNFSIERPKEEDIDKLWEIEQESWVPWLQRSREKILETMKENYEGFFVIKTLEGEMAGFHICNRINWDGSVETLKKLTWDDVNVKPYNHNGNTIVALSMSIAEKYRGQGIAAKLISAIKSEAEKDSEVKNFIGPFRPIQYGEYRMSINPNISFQDYCNLKREDGQLQDAWLRGVSRLGMEPLTPIENAMFVELTESEFFSYVNFEKNSVEPTKVSMPGGLDYYIFDVGGQVGKFYVQLNGENKIFYREPNLWGKIPLNK